MELLAGEDLATTLARERRLAWPRALHVALQLCDAMASVHAHGIVHRDPKPANCSRMTPVAAIGFVPGSEFEVLRGGRLRDGPPCSADAAHATASRATQRPLGGSAAKVAVCDTLTHRQPGLARRRPICES